MTSSYNLLRRRETDLQRSNIYDTQPGYMTTWGICPTGFTTYPFNNCTEAKICVKNPIPLKPLPSRVLNNPKYSYSLYQHSPSGSGSEKDVIMENQQFDRSYLEENDYLRVPFIYKGTGYEVEKCWRTRDYIHYKPGPIRQENRLIQPYLVERSRVF